MKQLIGIVDTGIANIGSIIRMLEIDGVNISLVNSALHLKNLDKIILPGIGHFSYGIKLLKDYQVFDGIVEFVAVKKRPILGICLGMQMLFEGSEEDNFSAQGLGLLEGKCLKINTDTTQNIKRIHMGWNNIVATKCSHLLGEIKEPRFYFVHSFHAVPKRSRDISATVFYGSTITAAVERENIYGVQFHPEKSHKFGRQLINNFCEI